MQDWRSAVVLLAIMQPVMVAAAVAAPSPLTRTLAREAQAIVAFDLASVAPVDPHEKPTRLQEFIVKGTVTQCFKGDLKPGQPVAYGLFAEGTPRVPPHTIVFLRHAKGHGDVWSSVDGPIFEDKVSLRSDLQRVTKECGK